MEAQSTNIFQYVEPLMGSPVEYPSSWFNARDADDKKPPLHINLSKDSNLENSRSWAYAVISGGSPAVYTAVEYLYHAFHRIEETIVSDWESYGVKIQKGKITPLSLLKVTTSPTEKAVSINQPVTLTSSDDLGLIMYLAGLYRIAKTHKRHQDVIAKRISPFIAASVSSTFIARITTNRNNGPLLATLGEAEILFSVLDMFLDRFPKHFYSKCRIGTIILRHMGFSVFNDITHFKNLTASTDQAEAIGWFFTPAADVELKRIVQGNEELCTPYSYLPYVMGLRLIHKSAYSAAANPNIHFTVHVVGTLFGSDRSINAIMGKNIKLSPCAVNAAIIFLKAKGTTLMIPQVIRAETYNKYKEAVKKHQAEAKGRAARNAFEVALMYKDVNYQFSEREVEVLRSAAENIENPRKGSVGKWVKNYFLSLIPQGD